MNTNRILIAVLVLNLFATLLVFRGMQILVDRPDQPQCAATAPAAGSPPGGGPVQGMTSTEGREGPAIAPRADQEAGPQSAEPRGAAGAASAHEPAGTHSADLALSQPELDDIAFGMDDLEGIKAQFASQYADSGWTAQVDEAFRETVVSNPAFGSVTQQLVECKERVCRLTLAYSDFAQFDEFVGQFTTAIEDEAPVSLYFEEPNTVAGNSQVDVYLVREQPSAPGVQ